MIEHRMSMFAGTAWLRGSAARLALPPEGAEERDDVLGEQVRYLERGEVAAARHLRPAPDVEERLGEPARRMARLTRERRIRHRHLDPRVRQRPGPVADRVV